MISRRKNNNWICRVNGAVIVAVLVLCGFTSAQVEQATPDKLLLTEAAVPAAANSSETAPVHASGMKAGDFPFKLTVGEQTGELIYTFNEKTQALETITGTNEVEFSTSGTVISADKLVYIPATSEVTTTGSVRVELPNLVYPSLLGGSPSKVALITADSLTYQLNKNRLDFRGGVVIMQKDPDGRVTETVSERITIELDDAGHLSQYRMKSTK